MKTYVHENIFTLTQHHSVPMRARSRCHHHPGQAPSMPTTRAANCLQLLQSGEACKCAVGDGRDLVAVEGAAGVRAV